MIGVNAPGVSVLVAWWAYLTAAVTAALLLGPTRHCIEGEDRMTADKRCPGCYDSFSGPWCDNCDQWPCICLNDKPKPPKEPTARDILTTLMQLGQAANDKRSVR